MKKIHKILCIGAHPDDIELGIGSTIQKHILNGDLIKCLILTDGARDENGYHIKSEIRRKESLESLHYLNITDITFLNFKEVRILPEIIKPIEKIIKEFNPDRIYTHTKHDRHQEHRNCFHIVQSIGRYIKEILLFEVYSSTPEFRPNYFIEFTEEILNRKIEALKFHKTQFEKGNIPLQNIISSISTFRAYSNYGGRQKFLPFVEAFEILKIFRTDDNV